jgi:RNA polymerase sigma factor (sigma-70 family)
MTDRMTEEQQALVENNVDLARKLAILMWRKNTSRMEKDEVIAIAYQGLIAAALKYDPFNHGMSPETVANGKAFAGFARHKIIGAVLEWQRSRDHVPKLQRRAYKEFQAHGLEAGTSAEEVAESTGYDLAKVLRIQQAVRSTPVSLDTPPELWDVRVAQELEASSDVESSALVLMISNSVAAAFTELPPLQQVVLSLKYYLGEELTVIAQALEIRLSDVREAHTDGLMALYDAMRREVVQ